MGTKTGEQQRRTLERKDDLPKETENNIDEEGAARASARVVKRPEKRASEYPVSRQGMHQESRHNKHNDGRSSGSSDFEEGSQEPKTTN
jgi:hypothetical protein